MAALQQAGVEHVLVARLEQQGVLPWCAGHAGAYNDPAEAAAALADPDKRAALFMELVSMLIPCHAQISSDLAKCLTEHNLKQRSSTSLATYQRPTLCGAGIYHRRGRGRSLVAEGVHLSRGSVVLRERPLYTAQNSTSPCDADSASGRVTAETALALRLWYHEVKGDCSVQEAREVLLEHGGTDRTWHLQQAVVAAACALALKSPGVGCSDDVTAKVAEQICAWLKCVRINAVAVVAVMEQDGVMENVKNALGMYPMLASCVNHDCRPNSILRFREDHEVELIVTSIAGIEPGDEITISYGPLAARLPKSHRQSALLRQYGFECTCISCSNTLPEDYSWQHVAEQRDAVAQREAAKCNWNAAVRASAAALKALRQGYCEGDVEMAREECKLAGLLLRAGDAEQAGRMWSRAAAMLQPVVSPKDPDLQEAIEMAWRLNSETARNGDKKFSGLVTTSSGPNQAPSRECFETGNASHLFAALDMNSLTPRGRTVVQSSGHTEARAINLLALD